MEETSKQAIQVLRALALAVRSEQDFGLVPASGRVVGALKRDCAVASDAGEAKRLHGYKDLLQVSGYSPLYLREALNKIAHANPRTADYYVGPRDQAHDLLLYGENHGQSWFAAISVLELEEAIRALPDASIVMS